MATVNGLIRDASKTAKFRGHSLKPWTRYEASADTSCKNCNAWVQVLTRPAPNQIGIAGSAVAVGCREGI